MKPTNRVTLILLGSAVYWIGYSGFFRHPQNIGYSLLCLFLIVSGLWVAGSNSADLYSGK